MDIAPRARRPAKPVRLDGVHLACAVEGVVMVANGRTSYEPFAPLSADVRPPWLRRPHSRIWQTPAATAKSCAAAGDFLE